MFGDINYLNLMKQMGTSKTEPREPVKFSPVEKGSCHKCAAQLSHRNLKTPAGTCPTCNIHFHQNDCGNRFAAAGIPEGPWLDYCLRSCPKCMGFCGCTGGPVLCNAARLWMYKRRKKESNAQARSAAQSLVSAPPQTAGSTSNPLDPETSKAGKPSAEKLPSGATIKPGMVCSLCGETKPEASTSGSPGMRTEDKSLVMIRHLLLRNADLRNKVSSLTAKVEQLKAAKTSNTPPPAGGGCTSEGAGGDGLLGTPVHSERGTPVPSGQVASASGSDTLAVGPTDTLPEVASTVHDPPQRLSAISPSTSVPMPAATMGPPIDQLGLGPQMLCKRARDESQQGMHQGSDMPIPLGVALGDPRHWSGPGEAASKPGSFPMPPFAGAQGLSAILGLESVLTSSAPPLPVSAPSQDALRQLDGICLYEPFPGMQSFAGTPNVAALPPLSGNGNGDVSGNGLPLRGLPGSALGMDPVSLSASVHGSDSSSTSTDCGSAVLDQLSSERVLLMSDEALTEWLHQHLVQSPEGVVLAVPDDASAPASDGVQGKAVCEDAASTSKTHSIHIIPGIYSILSDLRDHHAVNYLTNIVRTCLFWIWCLIIRILLIWMANDIQEVSQDERSGIYLLGVRSDSEAICGEPAHVVPDIMASTVEATENTEERHASAYGRFDELGTNIEVGIYGIRCVIVSLAIFFLRHGASTEHIIMRTKWRLPGGISIPLPRLLTLLKGTWYMSILVNLLPMIIVTVQLCGDTVVGELQFTRLFDVFMFGLSIAGSFNTQQLHRVMDHTSGVS